MGDMKSAACWARDTALRRLILLVFHDEDNSRQSELDGQEIDQTKGKGEKTKTRKITEGARLGRIEAVSK
jgi:hypothetical protein